MANKDVLHLLKDKDFLELSSKKKRLSIILTVMELVLYFGFISLIAYNKPFLSQKLGGSAITIGVPIAVGVIVISWLLTGVYIYWANNTYDKLVEKVKAKVGV